MAKMKRRRRQCGEVASRKEAIRNFCLECMGYQQAEIRRCTATECWLYPWRLGALDDKTIDIEKAQAKKKGVVKKKAKKTEQKKVFSLRGSE